MWNVALAQYDKKQNAVNERRILSGLSWQQAEEYIKNNASYPIYAYAEGCTEIDCPEFGMFITYRYKMEYRKVKD